MEGLKLRETLTLLLVVTHFLKEKKKKRPAMGATSVVKMAERQNLLRS